MTRFEGILLQLVNIAIILFLKKIEQIMAVGEMEGMFFFKEYSCSGPPRDWLHIKVNV